MRLTEAYIENFGKLHNQRIAFSPGLNVIYGENEAGKSTLQEFLTAMLFGMEPQQGRNKESDIYRKYEPWNAASYYCGTLRFEVDGKPFCLKRNFYHKEKTAELRNEADGEELAVEFGDLDMLLGNLSKTAYLNTWCIRQAGAATGKELAGILQEYLVNVENTKDANVSLGKALKKLEQRKKEILSEKKALLQKKQQRQEQLKLEENLLLDDIENLRGQLNQEKIKHDVTMQNLLMQQAVPLEAEETENPKKIKRIGKAALIFGVLFLLAVIVRHLFWDGRYLLPDWNIVEIVLGGMTLISLIHTIFLLFNKKKPLSKQKNSTKEISLEENQLRQFQILEKTYREQIREKELRFSNVREAMEEVMQIGTAEIENSRKEQAVLLAEQTLQRLSGSVSQEVRENLCHSASQVLAEITAGKYTDLHFDDELHITLQKDGREIPLAQLSRGTLEQVYFAVRLAVGEVLQEETLFYSFDETFAMYDENRLKSVLQYISERPDQSLVFTCSRRQMEILDENGISYHKILLEKTA